MATKPRKKVSAQRTTPAALVYQLRITLKGIRPPIWRRIQVPADVRLSTLHDIFQTVMGWENDHLHEFIIDGESYGDILQFPDGEVLDERKIRLDKVITCEKQRFFYVYDFGDSWEHQILLEKILPANPETQYPLCLSGKRACPPEDCGGPWGYEDLVEITQDPSHPEYEDRIEWLGENFDPERFSVEIINVELKRVRR